MPAFTAISYLLNPGGSRTTRRRPNRGTSAGVRKSWTTRKARYGDSGDSAAVKVLHGLGITGLSAVKARGAAKAKARKLVRRRASALPAYWKKLLAPKKKRENPSRSEKQRKLFGMALSIKRGRSSRGASSAVRRIARLVSTKKLRDFAKKRRKNAFFAFPEAHSKDALVKWGNRYWPHIPLYKFIKQHGIKYGQLEYARYCREHGISPRRRGSARGLPASTKKEQGMARKRRRKNASRRRSRRSASAPKRRRRAARRSNPTRKRRSSRRAAPRRRRARRRNPPILTQTNPTRKRRRRRSARRRNPPILMQTNPRKRRKSRRRSRGRRRNPPILMQTNPRKRRKSRRRSTRGRRRSNPSRGRRRVSRRRGSFRRNPNGGIMARLMDAIPTLADVVNVGIMSATGLFNRLFAGPIFAKLGLKETFDKVPYADRSILTVLETIAAGFFGGRRAAQMVMYGGLTSILTGVLGDKVLAAGLAGGQVKQYAIDAGFGGPLLLADYVTYGGGSRQLPNRMHDYVTMDGYEDGNEALECSPGTLETEGLSDYYGVTAF